IAGNTNSQQISTSFSPTTQAGNTWVAIVSASSDTPSSTNIFNSSTPSGWTLLALRNASEGGAMMAWYIRTSAPANSSTHTWTVTKTGGTAQSWTINLALLEVSGVPANSLEGFQLGPVEAGPSVSGTTRYPNTLAIAAVVGTSDPGVWFGGFNLAHSATRRDVVQQLTTTDGTVTGSGT